MDSLWSQKNSIIRDFVLLAAVIIFIAVLTSMWVFYETFNDQTQKVSAEIEQEALRIDRGFNSEIERATYLLEAIGRQILQRSTSDKTVIAQMLRAFDTSNDYYTVFLWVDENLQAVTSSRQGVLDKPVDLSDRLYIQKTRAEPFKIHIGAPGRGRITDKLVIPMGMGLTDFTGKYIGTVTLGLDLEKLTKAVQEYVRNKDVGFAILNENFTLLTKDKRATSVLESDYIVTQLGKYGAIPGGEGIISSPGLFASDRIFAYYRYSINQPYIIVTAYVSQWNTLGKMMLPRLLQLILVAAFLVSLLWLVRFRVISPVQNLAHAGAEIARGNTNIPIPQSGPLEISHLSRQLKNIVNYIQERKRIEEELIAKVLALKTAKDLAEVSDQAKMEILRVLKTETFPSMEQILTTASVLQEQPYGPIKGAEYKNYINQLDENSTHLTHIMHEIFEFPRLTQFEQPYTRKSVDVNGVLHKCVSLLGTTLKREDMKITIKTRGEMPKLAINEMHLIHVILQLLTVCIHAIPAGGELIVETALEENDQHTEFVLFFRDNGTGLDAQHIAGLWRTHEPGRRTHATREDARETSLSAVSLTKKIITLHNGRMTVQNPPGKEAIIAVYLQQ